MSPGEHEWFDAAVAEEELRLHTANAVHDVRVKARIWAGVAVAVLVGGVLIYEGVKLHQREKAERAGSAVADKS